MVDTDTNQTPASSGSRLIERAKTRLARDARRVTKRLNGSPATVDKYQAQDGRVIELYPKTPFDIERPSHFDATQWKVFSEIAKPELPAVFLMDIERAYVYGHDSWVFDRSGRAVTGMWRPHGVINEKRRIAELGRVTPTTLAKARRLEGTSLLLNQVGADNYFHFVNEIIPKISLSGTVMPLDEVDHFICHNRIAGFMEAWLSYAGIDTKNLVPMETEGFSCDRLLFSNNIAPRAVVPKWALDFSRSLIPIDTETPTPKRIFVSRRDATKRRLLNHEEIETLLEARGFEHVTMDARSPEQQASLFHNSDCIVGVHGAALSSIMFCEPRTKVIELMPNNHLAPHFWTTGQQLDLNYHLITGTETALSVPKWRRDVNADLSIDPHKLTQLLDTLL